MFEGSVSNLFVLRRDGVMMTAPDGVVLNGALRKIVLEVCDGRGMKVEMETPSVAAVDGFGAAFLTSVVRVLQPIKCFWKGEECLQIRPHEASEEAVDSIRREVWQRVCDGAVNLDSEAKFE